jgi:DNA polymerase/3'-5' exonuclease PolX
MKLEDARAIAESIEALLKPATHRIQIAGSIRREKSEVKDIEYVALVSDWDELYTRIGRIGYTIKPGTPEVIPWEGKRDAKYIRIMTHEDIKIDLFVASEDNWGPLLTMRTGSASGGDGKPFSGFVPALFQRWKKISGGGRMIGCMPTYPDGTSVVCREEEDFFNLLGMNVPPPQLRTEKGVIKKFLKDS